MTNFAGKMVSCVFIKAVKPGEDINENDQLIFCCRHPFFKNLYAKLMHAIMSCRSGNSVSKAVALFKKKIKS